MVGCFCEKTHFQFAAETWLACSPDWKHYSDFVKARTCLLLVDVEACYPQFETDVEKKEMRRRFQQVGAALRLATGPTSVEPQEAAEDSATVKRAFAGDLSVSEEKKMLTGLFTYHGVDGIPRAGCRQPNVEVLAREQNSVGPLLTIFWPGKKRLAA